mmetsp:Transcript_308/g.1199  ORF Transcript_308/g.1199 Transcript_308/m.1199 type:complete len:205 (+) Transcript_308:1219-1833(+)
MKMTGLSTASEVSAAHSVRSCCAASSRRLGFFVDDDGSSPFSAPFSAAACPFVAADGFAANMAASLTALCPGGMGSSRMAKAASATSRGRGAVASHEPLAPSSRIAAPERTDAAMDPQWRAAQLADCSRADMASSRLRSTTTESATTSANATAAEATTLVARNAAREDAVKNMTTNDAQPTAPERKRYDFRRYPKSGIVSEQKP